MEDSEEQILRCVNSTKEVNCGVLMDLRGNMGRHFYLTRSLNSLVPGLMVPEQVYLS